MYPIVRMMNAMRKARKMPKLDFGGVHVSKHLIFPWDMDIFFELNNGRTLTIYDLGRVPLAERNGLLGALKKNKWGLTIAGSSVIYRRRIKSFETVTMHSRAVGYDHRFFYLVQDMWVKDKPAGSALFRAALTSKDGIVPPSELFKSENIEPPHAPMPIWVAAWAEAESLRPWPPET